MAYELEFHAAALKEWQSLVKTGHRLVYQVIDDQVIVYVISVDKRDDLLAYRLAAQRINN